MSTRLTLIRSSDSVHEDVEMTSTENRSSASSTDKQDTNSSKEGNAEVNKRGSGIESTSAAENKSTKTPGKDQNKVTTTNEGQNSIATSSENGKGDKATTNEKEKDDNDDKADGYDPFSQESFRPLMSGNQYSMRKTASQALMDVALMMANISQLRTLLTAGDSMEYYIVLIVMVALSLGFQVLFAILIFMIWMRESEQHQKDEYWNTLREVTETSTGTLTTVKDKKRNSILRKQLSYQAHLMTSHLNYITMVLVFVITVINMFITGFGIKLESSTEKKNTSS